VLGDSSLIEALGEMRLLDDFALSEVEAIVGELKMILAEATFTGLRGCAIHSLLVPRLTELRSVLRDERGNALGSKQGFMALSARPWFREGRTPD
jgi:hypothetical protein